MFTGHTWKLGNKFDVALMLHNIDGKNTSDRAAWKQVQGFHVSKID